MCLATINQAVATSGIMTGRLVEHQWGCEVDRPDTCRDQITAAKLRRSESPVRLGGDPDCRSRPILGSKNNERRC